MVATKKAESVITRRDFPADGSFIEWSVAGGNADGTDAVLRVTMDKVSTENKAYASLYGIVQRVGDKAAIAKNTGTGKSATPVDKANAMRVIVDHLNSSSPDWSPARVEGVVGLDSIILAAVCEVTGKDEATVRGMIEAGAAKAGVKQSEYLATLGSSKLAAPVVARLRAERSGVDGDDILAGMMGEKS